jgi:hypothetical protein
VWAIVAHFSHSYDRQAIGATGAPIPIESAEDYLFTYNKLLLPACPSGCIGQVFGANSSTSGQTG